MTTPSQKTHRFARQRIELDEPFRLVKMPLPVAGKGEAFVEVGGCEVYHTDIGFWRGVYPHTISGTSAEKGHVQDRLILH